MEGDCGLKLASAAEDVKIWRTNDFSLCHKVSPKSSTHFQYIHWSCDSQQLVCVPAKSFNIALCLVKEEKLSRLNHIFDEESTAAQFSNTSTTELGVGNKHGKVLMFDIRDKKISKTFCAASSAVTSLQYNWNDSCIAVGCLNGGISLHNCTSGVSSKLRGDETASAVRSLQYSFCKKYLIASASDDGTIGLWDVNHLTKQHQFSFHVAPARGVRFSPSNAFLLVSVGLDKKIGCFDVKTKEVIKSIDCKVPITSVDFKDDGYTIAVGSSSGKILFYDLRTISEPYHVLSAHSSTVHYLAFQNGIARAKWAKKGSTFSDLNKLYDGLDENSTDSEIDSSHWSNFSQFQGTSCRYSLTHEIFSPIRETSAIGLNTTDKSGSIPNSSLANNLSDNFSVFSPITSSAVIVNSSDRSDSPLLLLETSSNKIDDITRPYEIISPGQTSNNNSHEKEFLLDHSSDKCIENSSVLNGSKPTKWPAEKPANSVQCGISCLSLKGICASNSRSAGSADDPFPSPKAALVDESPIVSPQAVTIVPPSEKEHLAIPSLKETDKCSVNTSDSVDEGRGTGALTTPMTPEVFQAEYIRQCISDEMEQLNDAMRMNVYRQHASMCRMFVELEHKMEQKMEALFAKYAVNTNLAKEVANLRKENHMLKNMFR